MVRPPIGFGHLSGTADELTTVTDEQPPSAEPTSLDAFLRLIRLGATGIAGTVWTTTDGVAVVQDQSRIAGTGRLGRFRRRPLAQLASDDLPPQAVRLDQLIARLEPNHQLSLRLGSRDAFEPAVAALRQGGDSLEQRSWFRHSDLALLADLRPRTSASLVREQNRAEAEGGLERQAAALEQRDIDGLLLPHREWTGGRTTLLHRFGRLALGSGAVHERELAELTDSGIDAIHSEQVARMMAVIVEYYGSIGGDDTTGTAPPTID
jgi:hypothetical protein